ncbi:UDP-glucoronosyl and UDP-glucosyl transferase family protein [Leishmania donovani]|uniref:UDP-glucoronosyl and UDP-glucosyl transferase family protein n=1 Tax=Leishmania donovani TaxID=5661 RepID=A0A504XBD3_LEIDO|nr:UDP-glucoronosyl and UDP-glucosyl transferase family protein [Leishmania donovani]
MKVVSAFARAAVLSLPLLLPLFVVLAAWGAPLSQAQEMDKEEISVRTPWHVAPSVPSLYRAAGEAPRLHVAVMSRAVWCETLLRHSQHTAPLVLANINAAAYAKPMSEGNGPLDVQGVVIPPCKDVFTERDFHAITSEKTSTIMSFQVLFENIFKHHKLALPDYALVAQAVHAALPLTMLLCDIIIYACAAVGLKMGFSVFSVFPFTAQMPVGLQAMLPADLPSDLAAFMGSCSQGVVYVNWGTLSLPDPGVEDRLQDALVEAAPLSVVWKRRTASARPPPPAARFYMTSWLPSTVAVLKHSNTRMFLTHCGVTSLLASVEAVVPNVGLPLFAGQADACQRVEEVGIRLPSSETKAFTRAGVVAVIAALRKLRAIATAYGGPQRAADIIEGRQYNLLIGTQHSGACASLSVPLQIEYALAAWSAA